MRTTSPAQHSRRAMIGIAGVGIVGAVLGQATTASASAARFTATTKTTTDQLNKWLAERDGTGIRRLTGTVTLTKPLVIPAGTVLDAHGATITGPPSDNLLRNAASIAVLVAQVSVTAGSGTVTITQSGKAFTPDMVGRRMQVLDAGSRTWRAGAPSSLYGTITAVAGATQVTLDVPASSTLTAQAYVYPPSDVGITIQGGTWINRNKNTLSQQLASHGFLIRRASRVTITDLTIKGPGAKQMGGQYAMSIGDVTNVTVSKVTFTNVSSDGVHFQGPASGLTVRDVTGSNSGDDLVAFTGVDGKSSNGSRLGDCEGDISDVLVQNVRGTACHTLLKVTSGVGAGEVQRHVMGFRAVGLSGTVSTGGSPVNVVDYAGTTSFSGSIEDVTATPSGTASMVNIAPSVVGDVTVSGVTWAASFARVPTTGIVRFTGTTAQSVTVRNVVRRDTAGRITDLTGCGVSIGTATVGTLTVSGVACPVAAPHFDSVQLARAVRIGALTIASDTSSARTGNVLYLPAAAAGYAITSATFSSVTRSTGSLWAADADGLGEQTAIAVHGYTGGKAVAILRSPAELRLWDLAQKAGTGAAVRLASPAASPVRVVTARSTRPSPLLSRSAQQQASVSSGTIPVDFSLLTPLDGDGAIDSRAVAKGVQYWSAAAGAWGPTKQPAAPATPEPTPSTPAQAPVDTPSAPAPTPSAPPVQDPTPAPVPNDIPVPTQTPVPVPTEVAAS